MRASRPVIQAFNPNERPHSTWDSFLNDVEHSLHSSLQAAAPSYRGDNTMVEEPYDFLLPSTIPAPIPSEDDSINQQPLTSLAPLPVNLPASTDRPLESKTSLEESSFNFPVAFSSSFSLGRSSSISPSFNIGSSSSIRSSSSIGPSPSSISSASSSTSSTSSSSSSSTAIIQPLFPIRAAATTSTVTANRKKRKLTTNLEPSISELKNEIQQLREANAGLIEMNKKVKSTAIKSLEVKNAGLHQKLLTLLKENDSLKRSLLALREMWVVSNREQKSAVLSRNQTLARSMLSAQDAPVSTQATNSSFFPPAPSVSIGQPSPASTANPRR